MSYAKVVFPELEKELQRRPKIIGKLRGVFEVKVLERGQLAQTYYIHFTPRRPSILTTKPIGTGIDASHWVTVTLEDRDMLKIISGTSPHISYITLYGQTW